MLLIKARIYRVEILRIHAVLSETQGVAKALVMDELALTEEFEGLADVGVVDHSDKVVVGDACFLLCCNYVLTTKS